MIPLFITIFNKLCRICSKTWNNIKIRSYHGKIHLRYGTSNFNLLGSIYYRIKKDGKISIGDSLTVFSGACYNPISRNIKTCFFVEENAIVNIGNNVGISASCIWAHQLISIGDNVKIGADSVIIDSDCHSIDFCIRSGCDDTKHKTDKPVIIENDVLIGTRCVVLKGVTIGARSIIGAGSVVTKSIPQDCIAAGNPCIVIKRI